MTIPRIVVIGAGPAGLFCAAQLLAKNPDVEIDILDRSRTPFGLVRYGVAPDHQKIKSVTKVLSKTLSSPRVRFLGGVAVGSGGDVTMSELRERYHVVVVATGATQGRRLGVPGDELPGSHPAGEIVFWYNGQPGLAAPATGPWPAVAVVGGGNVAIDVARVLLKSHTELCDTDIPRRTLAQVAALEVTTVHVLVRGGPLETRFGSAELRQLEELDDLRIIISDATGQLSAGSGATSPAGEILCQWSRRTANAGPASRTLHLHFGAQIERIHGWDQVSGVSLKRLDDGLHVDRERTLDVNAVVAAIGFRGEPLDELPFDDRKGVIPNVEGRVAPGVYVVGWIKNGPRGVIGTNKADAILTASAVLCDLGDLLDGPRDGAVDLLANRGVVVTDWQDWLEIDAAEVSLGQAAGVARIKPDTEESAALAH